MTSDQQSPRVIRRARTRTRNSAPLNEGFQPLYLDIEFRDRIPAQTERPGKRRPNLTVEQKRWILWRAATRDRPVEIAEKLGIPQAIISMFLSRSMRDPGIFLNSRFVQPLYGDDGDTVTRWICRLCGGWFGTRPRAVDHAAKHIWPDRIARLQRLVHEGR